MEVTTATMNELTDFWRSLNPVAKHIIGGILLGFGLTLFLMLMVVLILEGFI